MMVCSFQVCGEVNQLCTYSCPLFFRCFPMWVITECWVQFPLLHSRFSLLTCFTHSSVYVSTPDSPGFLPLIHICLFSSSGTLFLLYKQVHL